MAYYKLVIITLAFVFLNSCSADQLSPTYYAQSCPSVFGIVSEVVTSAIKREKRMGASLLRLHFHDCFVNGCDGSVLLDGNSREKFAAPNKDSLRGFEVIDEIKTKLEERCPGVVSCADVLAIAAMESVANLGGFGWYPKLGRKDSTTASKAAAENGALPSPASNLTQLIKTFSANNLTKQDLVVLSGAHTIGLAKCSVIRSRIYNETDIDKTFSIMAQNGCPIKNGDNNLEPLDKSSPEYFDNGYYKAVMKNQTLLHSDQQLFSSDRDIKALVNKYINYPYVFYYDFGVSMVKMGDIMPLTGNKGEIRKDCRKANKKTKHI